VALVFLAYSSYCYSNEVFETSQNAANAGLNWVMTNILPEYAGLSVNSVIYRYTAIKDPETGMIVYVQNKNAQGNGYVFREKDDWTGLPGNTINKVVPVANIPRELWGDGSIKVEGEGSVTDAYVAYGYQYDPCYDPQTDPSCPGYTYNFDYKPLEIDNPFDSDYIQDELNRKNVEFNNDDQKERDRKKSKDEDGEKKESLEDILGIVNDNILFVESQIKINELANLNAMPTSYFIELNGGKIEDTIVLKDAILPNNPRSRQLSLAQDKLHNELVNSQYKRN
jgi:hypothetical protein